VADYPKLLTELLRRGVTEQQVRKLVGLNLLRVMQKAETVAARIQKEAPGSDARLEELDK
jgi:membrane dipeptidase